MKFSPEERRIAFLLNDLHGGGAERVVVTLCNTLSMMGCCVTLLLARHQGPYLGDLSPRVRVLRLKGGRMLFAIPSLVTLIRRERFQCVLAGMDQPNIALLFARFFLPSTTKCFITEHSHPVVSEKSVNNPIWWSIRRLRRLLYPLADHVIAVSENVRQALIDQLRCRPERVTTLHNPIDIEQAERLATEAPPIHWFRDRRIPLLVTAGRLDVAKDYPVMLKAVATLRQRRPVRLIILGDGNERQHLEELRDKLGLQDCVAMPGFMTNPFSFMAAADCFVIASRWEGFGNVIVEALACGTPVVSTNCGGPREILGNGRYGRLVPTGDPIALASAIATTLDSPRNSVELKERATHFTPERVAKQYLQLIDRVIIQ